MSPELFKKKVLPLQNKLFSYSLRLLGNSEDAKDAVQEVFIKLWKRRETLEEYRSLEAFSMRVTRNLCLDRLKARKPEYVDEKTLQMGRTSGSTPAEILERKETYGRIKEIISALPENQRSVIHLRDIEGYEYKEMGEILNMDLNNIRVLLSRARKAVRKSLTKR
ncbi:MAG: RNA polymerase sigma factor [Bacteroidales bacterium]|nr:RNA polymerase sigma factor [Bacteroidales bacterium]